MYDRIVLYKRCLITRTMIASMCSELRPPRRSIPPEPGDEDNYIIDTLKQVENMLLPSDPEARADFQVKADELTKEKTYADVPPVRGLQQVSTNNPDPAARETTGGGAGDPAGDHNT